MRASANWYDEVGAAHWRDSLDKLKVVRQAASRTHISTTVVTYQRPNLSRHRDREQVALSPSPAPGARQSPLNQLLLRGSGR